MHDRKRPRCDQMKATLNNKTSERWPKPWAEHLAPLFPPAHLFHLVLLKLHVSVFHFFIVGLLVLIYSVIFSFLSSLSAFLSQHLSSSCRRLSRLFYLSCAHILTCLYFQCHRCLNLDILRQISYGMKQVSGVEVEQYMCLGWVVFLSDPAYPEKGL